MSEVPWYWKSYVLEDMQLLYYHLVSYAVEVYQDYTMKWCHVAYQNSMQGWNTVTVYQKFDDMASNDRRNL